MILLSCRAIKKEFGEHLVLKNVNLNIHIGDRIGLVGRNGAGKTTLVNIIFGSVQQDDGVIVKNPEMMKIGYLMQSTDYTINTFNDMIFNENAEKKVGSFLQVATHLGLEKVHQWQLERFQGLSGGEKKKLALANVWASKPDLLILDEPTNHMDYQGIEWLIGELKKYRGTVLIISHDRYFLDRSVNRIVELEDGVVTDYEGSYSSYRNEKRRRYDIQMHQYLVDKRKKEKVQEEIERLKGWSEKAHRQSTKAAIKAGRKFGGKEYYRAKAKKMDRQIKSKLKRLEKLNTEVTDKPKEEEKIQFEFLDSEKHGKRIIEVQNVGKSFGERVLFRRSSFFIQYGERIGIIGPNGCGKTTLIRMLLGQESLTEGERWASPSLKIAYLSQDVADLDDRKTVAEALNITQGVHDYVTKARTLLANIGFKESMLMKRIGQLSLGERMRIKLAELVLRQNDIIIMDEPTNHLDLHSRERLEETLESYTGTILVVSHDRYFLEKICRKLLVFENGLIKRVEYGLREYLTLLNGKRSDKLELARERKEQKMLLENRIACILGELSQYSPEDTEYQRLDQEFQELIKRKQEL